MLHRLRSLASSLQAEDKPLPLLRPCPDLRLGRFPLPRPGLPGRRDRRQVEVRTAAEDEVQVDRKPDEVLLVLPQGKPSEQQLEHQLLYRRSEDSSRLGLWHSLHDLDCHARRTT